jgi:ABC-type sugar transport system permease subunit
LTKIQKHIAKTAIIFILPVLLYNILFKIVPVFYSFFLSLTDFDGFSSPQWVGITNYSDIFRNSEFWNAVGRTFQFSAEVLPANMLLSLLLALLANRRNKGIGIFRAVCYLPVITPMVAASVIWMWLYDPRLGIINFFLSLFSVPPIDFLHDTSTAIHSIAFMRIWRGVGWNMLIYLAGLQGIPLQYYEAAKLDGASALKRFIRITLPLLRPVHSYVLIMGLISTLQSFTEMYVMTQGGPMESTTTVGILAYRFAFDYMKMGYGSAMSFTLGVFIMGLSVISFIRKKKGGDNDITSA